MLQYLFTLKRQKTPSSLRLPGGNNRHTFFVVVFVCTHAKVELLVVIAIWILHCASQLLLHNLLTSQQKTKITTKKKKKLLKAVFFF